MRAIGKFTLALWVPLFTVAMVLAAFDGMADLGLFAIAMGLALWGVCEAAALLWHHLQAWSRNRRAHDRGAVLVPRFSDETADAFRGATNAGSPATKDD